MIHEIKNRYTGNIIYQAEAENFKALVEAAVKAKANLRGADLYGADLYGADLRGADLSVADLRVADLSGADLSGADLSEANIANTILPEKFPMARLDFGGWSILVTSTHTTIGCQKYPNSDWLKWGPKDVADFADGAFDFWKQHGPTIKAAIKDVQSQAKKVKI